MRDMDIITNDAAMIDSREGAHNSIAANKYDSDYNVISHHHYAAFNSNSFTKWRTGVNYRKERVRYRR
jgi:hypothetical protein